MFLLLQRSPEKEQALDKLIDHSTTGSRRISTMADRG